ncbi:MAG: Uma2 family endonuclease [Tildeniella nuda ZEHNDER 1965/U140]|jgi:Uma2 family endonuclease|nr:Uma2 family endonuclease [Tildeniella nuda ZEHNDER 1965/U140]
MTSFAELPNSATKLPDHTQLPESDGTFVKNSLEHPQSLLLTDSITPTLDALHPNAQYFIGQDTGIYWRIAEPPEPLVRGAESPDWFYVPNVPSMLDGTFRRSYVLWQEFIAPLIVLEFVSGTGAEERDRTPWTGKFWIYEQVIRPAFYGIYEVTKASVEVYHLVEGQYRLLPTNDRGHFPIPQMGVELGIWHGHYINLELPWLRWWDDRGNLLLNGQEKAALADVRTEQAERQLEQAESQLEQERQRSERLAALLRAQGIEPDV